MLAHRLLAVVPSYTWQKLRGGHRALSDTRAVIRLLEEMAAYPSPFDRTEESVAT
ncbi:hypothetical protein [Streptomyces sp. NPDC101455]|uniref:hypothetical protein n=1 Tax=Streptomyces sp. NPDC101455 TaxID=3366142 RepID=UPI0037FF2DC0